MHVSSVTPNRGIQPKAFIQTPTAGVKLQQDESLQAPNSFFSFYPPSGFISQKWKRWPFNAEAQSRSSMNSSITQWKPGASEVAPLLCAQRNRMEIGELEETLILSRDNIQESSLCLQSNSGLGFVGAWWRGGMCRIAAPELAPSLGQSYGWHLEPEAVSLNLTALSGLFINYLTQGPIEQVNFQQQPSVHTGCEEASLVFSNASVSLWYTSQEKGPRKSNSQFTCPVSFLILQLFHILLLLFLLYPGSGWPVHWALPHAWALLYPHCPLLNRFPLKIIFETNVLELYGVVRVWAALEMSSLLSSPFLMHPMFSMPLTQSWYFQNVPTTSHCNTNPQFPMQRTEFHKAKDGQ